MESHTAEPPVEEVTENTEPNPESSLPDVGEVSESVSFTEALEKALSRPAETNEASPDPEIKEEEPKKQPKEKPKEESKEEVTESSEDTKAEVSDSEKETDPIEQLTEEIGDDWTPKAAKRFKELKTELKTNRSEVDTLRQTVKEQEAKLKEMTGLVENKDVEELQSKLSEYENEKMMSDLTDTVAYKDSVTNPMNQILEQAEGIMEGYEVDKDSLVDILLEVNQETQDKLLTDILEGVSDRDRARMYRLAEDIVPLMARSEELMTNAEAALQEAKLLEEQNINSELAEQAKHRETVTKNVVKRVSEKLPFLNGLEEVNLEEIQNKVSETDPSVIHPVDFAYNAVASQLLPTLVKQYVSSRKEVEILTDKLSEYEEAEPTMSGSPAVDSSGRPSKDLSFQDAIAAALGG